MSLHKNNETIMKAFERLKSRKDEAVISGMYALLDAGLDYLHEAHESWMHHENETNTLGWALIHHGQVMEAVSQAKGEWTPGGDAVVRLREIAAEVPHDAFVGVILSDMANGWYRLDWEMGFLEYSATEVKNNFRRFFKPIAR